MPGVLRQGGRELHVPALPVPAVRRAVRGQAAAQGGVRDIRQPREEDQLLQPEGETPSLHHNRPAEVQLLLFILVPSTIHRQTASIYPP